MLGGAWLVHSGTLRETARAFGYSLAIAGLVLAVGAATDEGGIRWTIRVARVAPLAPIAGLAGAALAASRARRSGEMRAVLALGMHPWVRTFAWISGALVAPIAVAIALLRGLSIDGFFPEALHAHVFVWGIDGAASESLGVVVGNSGVLEVGSGQGVTSRPPIQFARSISAATTLVVGAAFAMIGASSAEIYVWRAAATVIIVVLSTIGCLQLAAAQVLSPFAALCPAICAFGYGWSILLHTKEQRAR
jgi:hypothetical protein